MSYIVGATPKRGKRRYLGKGLIARTRVEAKTKPFTMREAHQRARIEQDRDASNVQVIRCEGWGRPAKKRTSRAR